jgi:hypothetical protein
LRGRSRFSDGNEDPKAALEHYLGLDVHEGRWVRCAKNLLLWEGRAMLLTTSSTASQGA